MTTKTNGGNGGYQKKSGVSDNPRTPKNAPTSGERTTMKRSQDGTRQNGKKSR